MCARAPVFTMEILFQIWPIQSSLVRIWRARASSLSDRAVRCGSSNSTADLAVIDRFAFEISGHTSTYTPLPSSSLSLRRSFSHNELMFMLYDHIVSLPLHSSHCQWFE